MIRTVKSVHKCCKYKTGTAKRKPDSFNRPKSLCWLIDDATLKYDKQGKDDITFTHTDVPPVFQGKGVGSKLAKFAFDFARENSLKVTCQCHFLAHYYKNHKDQYKNLKIKFDLEEDENTK